MDYIGPRADLRGSEGYALLVAPGGPGQDPIWSYNANGLTIDCPASDLRRLRFWPFDRVYLLSYPGALQSATEKFDRAIPELARRGWVPVSQIYIPGPWAP
jgi:hypothetical protein